MPAHPLDPDDRTVMVSLKMPARLLAEAHREARRRGDTFSVVVRTLLRQWLDDAPPARAPRSRKRASQAKGL